MAGICTGHLRKNGVNCDHRLVTVVLDGEEFIFDTGEGDLDRMPYGAEEKRQLALLCLRRLRADGLSLDNSVGRIFLGAEATNVKQYTLLSKDVTKTNIGTAYVNVPPGLNGERSLVEFTGCTEFRLVLHANLVGTGPWQARVVRDSDSAVLYESPSLTQSGERELDSGWLALPGGINNLEIVRLQAKSITNADDPIFRRCILLVR
jgi:hypothetical protein